MRHSSTAAVLITILLTACGSGGADKSASGKQSAAGLAALPATVEGMLDMSAGEGDEGEGGQEVLFGMLTVDGHEHYVEVAPGLVESATITEDIAKVRATVSSREDLGQGVISYKITALEKL